ncbi:MAG TPA: hypothetical protein VK663_09045 [Burkholderiales bacterium]|nr:hypothetical protein [Burkholderiales bacterium]
MRKILLLLILLSFGVSLPPIQDSHAQQIRSLPANGKRGVTGNSLMYPQVTIGKETLTLAPGGLIFDTFNRTVVHGSLPVGADVWYQVNNGGQIQRIYVLRPEERARLDQDRK